MIIYILLLMIWISTLTTEKIPYLSSSLAFTTEKAIFKAVTLSDANDALELTPIKLDLWTLLEILNVA